MKPRRRLFRKYAVRFMTLVGGVLLLSGSLDLYFSFRENETALFRLEREKADAAAGRIEQFVRTIEDQIGWATRSMALSPGARPDRRWLDALLKQVPSITDVSYLDASGKELFRISRVKEDVIGSKADYANAPVFQVPKSGKTYFGPVEFRNESEPYLTIARAGTGPQAGVIVADVNLKFIWDVVSRLKVGGAGYAYVVDARGVLVAHPDISLVLQKTDLSSLPQVRAVAIAEPPGIPAPDDIETGKDLRDRSVLTAHARITPLGWWVFVEEPVREAFAPVYASLYRIGVLMVIALALSMVASLFLTAQIVRPIEALQVGAARIGSGELDQRIEVRTGDEIEALATQFNEMAAQLKESYAGLERKVDERTQQLIEANRHKSQFLANMSHEFRTPMNAIIGFSEVLLDPSMPVSEEERTQFLTDILNSGKHLLQLINEVLDLSKIEAGRMELHLAPAALGDVLDTVQSALWPLAAKKSIQFQVDRAEGIAPFPMDASRIKQVLVNLVGNAIKFTPDGGRVWVQAAQDNGEVQVEVGDTGPGIAPEDHELIFQEFQQAQTRREAGKPEGTGLGLALAKRFVEMHNGKLWVESAVGAGSRFYFRLPITESPSLALP